jgi:hypothetical protein
MGVYHYGENKPPANRPADADTMLNTLIAQAGKLGVPAGNFDQPVKDKIKLSLFDTTATDLNGAVTNVATKDTKIRHALAMDTIYPDNTPCPPDTGGTEQTMATAIINSMPGPIA